MSDNHTINIAIDVMGGDNAPIAPIMGAGHAIIRCPRARFMFFGREQQIREQAEKIPQLADKYSIIHTDEMVANDEKPSMALRNGKNSSMALAIKSVAEGQAQAIVSAGNTGALMALAMFGLRKIEGIHRPALCSTMPSMRGKICMLDLGGVMDCDANNLYQFAIMGHEFARIIHGLKNPKIALLNVGSEAGKGTKPINETDEILRNDKRLNYIGFAEGDDIGKGIANVYVTDGFTGNLLLKMAEGTAKLLTHFLRESLNDSLMGKLGYVLARDNFNRLKLLMDPRKYNGAVFLGLNGITVKSHGGTDELGYATAIELAYNLSAQDFITHISENINQFHG